MINTSPLPHPHRAAPPALWALARACLGAIAALFGRPGDVAAQGWLARRTRNLLRAMLNAAHAVIARLLLIEAAALPAPAPARAQARRTPRVRRTIAHYAHAPEHWRVTLRLMRRRRPRAQRPSAPAPAAQRDPLDAWPLAERYEALTRACADPAPYARRLARRLHAAPRRAAQLLARAAPAASLITPDAGAALDAAAAEACAAIASRIRAPP